MMREVQTRIERALARVRLAFRGRLVRLDTAPGVQLAQLDGLADEQLQAVELMQHYGLTSHPPAGTMAIILPVGGRTAHGVVIATEHGAYRLKGLAAGEVAIYTDEGDRVHLKRGRVVEIVAGAKVRIDSPLVEVTGEIKDRCDSGGRTMASMRQIYDSHTHPGDSGGTTGMPNQGMA